MVETNPWQPYPGTGESRRLDRRRDRPAATAGGKMNDLELCCAYRFFISGQIEQEYRDDEKVDFYAAEHVRVWLHNEICKAIGLSKNETKAVLYDLGKYHFNPHRVYEALLYIKENKTEEERHEP
jgi:hypothetical protein